MADTNEAVKGNVTVTAPGPGTPPVKKAAATLPEQFGRLIGDLQSAVGLNLSDMPAARQRLVVWYRNLSLEQRKELAPVGRLFLTRAKQISEALYQEFYEITSADV